jgi:ribose transport system permease protein
MHWEEAMNIKTKFNTLTKGIFKGNAVILPFIVVCLILSVTTEQFLTYDNILNILRQSALYVVMATGMTFVMISGGIDLSQGSGIAFIGIVFSIILKDGEGSLGFALMAGLLIGIGIGLCNGLGIAFLKLPPFIMTLGTMQILRGLSLVISDGKTINAKYEPFRVWGQGYFLSIPIPVYIFLVVAIIGYFILKHTKTGRYIYAIGSNQNAARLSGVNVEKTQLFTYIFSGFCVSISAIVYLSRIGAVQPTAGEGYEMDSIAAAVVGGTSMSGGSGGIFGTVLGAILMLIIKNGMILLSVPTYYQRVVTGLIIIVAVAMDTARSGKRMTKV